MYVTSPVVATTSAAPPPRVSAAAVDNTHVETAAPTIIRPTMVASGAESWNPCSR